MVTSIQEFYGPRRRQSKKRSALSDAVARTTTLRGGSPAGRRCFETPAFGGLLSMRGLVSVVPHALILRSGPQDRVSKDAAPAAWSASPPARAFALDGEARGRAR
jgi:hypothetical protein